MWGDFPNTIYVILYDKEYVKRVISESLNDHNSNIYIDKIIQVEYTIPENNIDNSRQLLLNHLSSAIEKAIPESKPFWSRDEINDVLKIDQFHYYIKHLRDIKRFTNNFLLRYKSISSEVNFKQFLLLELLRYKHPEFVAIIFNSKDIFLSQFEGNDSFGRPEIPLQNDFWSKLVANENARGLLREMAKYKNDLRSISDSSFFTNYFTLTLLSNFISEGEFSKNMDGELDEVMSTKYKEWLLSSRDILSYRFRNYDGIGTVGKFINYVNHLGFVQNTMLISDRVSSNNISVDLSKIFINKYLKLASANDIDSKTLYTETSNYLFTTGQNVNDSLPIMFFTKCNTSFLNQGQFQG